MPSPHETVPVLTAYHERHAITYLRLLDAEAEGAAGRKLPELFCASILSGNPGGASRLGEPSRPLPLDDRARLPAPASRRGSALKSHPAH